MTQPSTRCALASARFGRVPRRSHVVPSAERQRAQWNDEVIVVDRAADEPGHRREGVNGGSGGRDPRPIAAKLARQRQVKLRAMCSAPRRATRDVHGERRPGPREALRRRVVDHELTLSRSGVISPARTSTQLTNGVHVAVYDPERRLRRARTSECAAGSPPGATALSLRARPAGPEAPRPGDDFHHRVVPELDRDLRRSER